MIQGSDVSEISKKVEEFLGVSSSSSDVCARQNLSQNVPLKHIGSDESGKGDFFGPLVIAGVLVDESNIEVLQNNKPGQV